jgi:hypothetical protein
MKPLAASLFLQNLFLKYKFLPDHLVKRKLEGIEREYKIKEVNRNK